MATSMKRRFQSDSSEEEEENMVAAAVLCLAVELHQNQRAKRSTWARSWLQRRETQGACRTLLQELLREDSKETRRFLRMSEENFREVLRRVGPRIQKVDTRMRKAIGPGERLAITLRFLGSGETFVNISHLFRVADNTIHGIVMETCVAIYDRLKDDYLKVPSTEEEWNQISLGFETRWQLPNCIGALDGKHVQINSPGRGSEYFNYANYHSIILLALVDAGYRIIWFDVGTNGRAGDAAVFRDSSLADGLEKNTLGIPGPKPLPGRREAVPHFIVGDDAFGLKPYLMKPFPFRTVCNSSGLGDDAAEVARRKQRIFDYRVSRARRLSENVFGILASRFGVFKTAMRLSPESATIVTLACLALHNYLVMSKDARFATPAVRDREHPTTHQHVDGEWRQNGEFAFQNLGPQAGNRNADYARRVRDEIMQYVNAEGQVPWQEQLVFGRMLD